MTGVQLILGAAAGVAGGIAITALRWVLVRRFASTPIPPSAEVLEAERTQSAPNPLTDGRTR